MRLRPRRLGLRSRITLAFGLGSLLLSVALSTSTWAFTRQAQLSLREPEQMQSVRESTTRILDQELLTGPRPEEGGLRDALTRLPSIATSVIVRENVSSSDPSTTSSNVRNSFDGIPRSVRELVENGEPARMRYRLADTPMLVIGVPLPTVDAEYYELFDLRELERSLDLIAAYLTAATLLVTVAGAGLGWWASRRTLLPLTDVGLAAHAIAAGRLDTRLEAANDPDLAVLVSSFNEMAATLQARIERDARFASDVSHELRSPLMTLAASVEVLETRREELPDRSRAALDLLVDDVNRFQQLVSDLLEISRFDAGAAHLELEPVLLPEFLSRAVAASTHRPVPVITDGESAELIVDVDKRRMAQAIANLLTNAEKYAGGATAVRVSRVADDEVEVAVEDEGPGVDPDDRGRIFERFSRGVATAGARGSDTGSGLGLALVSEHVGLHGGRVAVGDRRDGRPGASFSLVLPVDVSLSDGGDQVDGAAEPADDAGLAEEMAEESGEMADGRGTEPGGREAVTAPGRETDR